MMSKREQFRKYLEAGNVIETLNKAMFSIHSEDPRPADPLAFIREVIGAPPAENVDALIRKNQDLHARVIMLRNQLDMLNSK
ncbi:hypothetical protein TVAG_284050 [Trichomonas vaginalis G3]|uniref:c-Myc-binding protein n=1 Tax=Trichomonas vaginalis (strain ATCC PRA-98 / G3) TaxID=412133 RepID=A2FF68_TRIV3|nr:associate of C-MYC AMY-1 family [Trichomonas vaginalis G3]EAX96435.1 hypothetical protein TVAG_284050 [Trichomonas vaginalis G3]KAI5482826.1 associate of C-MYC AMY-1 family [Trichomonas vaginalis G3]|eukprot:XP_001309365.1 hypothetical protein [Trichomonas vaginalis G3]